MRESNYNHSDSLRVRPVILSTLRPEYICRDFATKSALQFRQLLAPLIQFQQAIQKQMLSRGAPWSLWTDNRIKSKKL